MGVFLDIIIVARGSRVMIDDEIKNLEGLEQKRREIK